MKKHISFGLIALLLIAMSCRTHLVTPTDNPVASVDSIPVVIPGTSDSISIAVTDTFAETPAETTTVITPFPDTIFPSAEKLLFVIDTFETAISGIMNDLSDKYEGVDGIYMFRGAPSRNPNFHGMIHGDTINIHTEWVFTTVFDKTKTSHGSWGGGTGWTGQPLYVHWPDSLQEIICGSLCGYVYFIDYQTGEPSRDYFDSKNVLKGTPSFDPSMNGNLYIGHGVEKQAPFGNAVYNMVKGEQTHSFGKDPRAWRAWGAYDSSPVVIDSFLFRPGENGTLYKYYIGNGKYLLHSTLRYSTSQIHHSPGIESSMAVCRNYGYTTDNMGNILCINLNTLKPVWHYNNHDDTDATPLVDVEDGIPYVYTGCEIDKQGLSGASHFVKLHGLTGELEWEVAIPGKQVDIDGKTLNGGMFGSPLMGSKDCSNLLFSNFCMNNTEAKGYLVAMDKADGSIVYQTKTHQYAWSSPIPFFNDRDEMFIFTADCNGYVYLIKGKTGEIVASKKVGANFESSPIVVDDKVILGSRGNKIYKIALE